MKIEYLTDENGNQKAVVIPISEWKKFFSEFNNLKNETKSKSIPPTRKKLLKKSNINTNEVFGMWKEDFPENESSEDIQRRWRKEQWR